MVSQNLGRFSTKKKSVRHLPLAGDFTNPSGTFRFLFILPLVEEYLCDAGIGGYLKSEVAEKSPHGTPRGLPPLL